MEEKEEGTLFIYLDWQTFCPLPGYCSTIGNRANLRYREGGVRRGHGLRSFRLSGFLSRFLASVPFFLVSSVSCNDTAHHGGTEKINGGIFLGTGRNPRRLVQRLGNGKFVTGGCKVLGLGCRWDFCSSIAATIGT